MKSLLLKIWSPFKTVLDFFGLIDEKSQLSRTNLLVYIFTMKFAFVPMESASIHDMALALAALGVYMGKKVVNAYTEGARVKADLANSDVLDKLHSMGVNEEGE